MVAAAAGFATMLAFVKSARGQGLGTFEVVFWRAVFAVPLAALTVRLSGFGWRLHARGLFGLRVALGFGAMACFFTAARDLGLADLTLLSRLQPVVLTLLAPVFLGRGESVGHGIWALLLIGLAGSLVLLLPGGSVPTVPALPGLLALAGAVLSAAAHLCLRHLGRTDAPGVLVFWFQTAVTVPALLAAVAAAGGSLPVPPSSAWPTLLGCGAAAAAGQWCLTRAYQAERAAIVAAASYTGPLWAVGIDVWWFDIAPTARTALGGVLIVAAGVGLAWRREGRSVDADLQTDHRAAQEAVARRSRYGRGP